MLMDIQKCSFAYLRNVFSSLESLNDYVFWIRSKDMSKQFYTSDSYKNIWDREIEVIFEIPILWLDYLLPDHRVNYLKQFQARHDQGYRDPEKNIAFFQITTPSNQIRYLLDRCYRCQSLNGAEFVAGYSKSISPEAWSTYYENAPDQLSEEDKKAEQHFFKLLKKEFGIKLLPMKNKGLIELSDKTLFAKEIQTFGLSQREFECLGHICLGKSYKEVAREMLISPRTVETYIKNILSKTNTKNKIEVISRFAKVFS